MQSVLAHIGDTPLVRLEHIGRDLPVPVLVKCEHLNPRGSIYEVEGIGASKVPGNLDRSVIDAAERVTDDESFALVRRLVREEGLYVGGSAGTNLAAALRLAARGDLHGPVITVMCDSWDRYRAKPWMQGWEEA